MILALILGLPLVGGLAAWLSERLDARLPRSIALAALVVDFLLVAYLWLVDINNGPQGRWLVEFNVPWLPSIGVSFYLAADGITVVLMALTAFLGCMATLSSWTEIRERQGFFYLCLTWVLAGVLGVFMALDLFLFYFAWELMLVPMYFLIAIWGHEDRFRAALKFFIFTQLGGLFMLAAILGLYFVHARDTGVYTFDYIALLDTAGDSPLATAMLCCFLAAFLVKLPAVPFHTWLPDAHTQAPTAASIILAGLLLKTGAYGCFRLAVPLFPAPAQDAAPVLAILGAIGVLYGAVLAFAQSDMKRLIAYTSVSHMGFVLLGIFVGNELAFQGAMIQIVAHGLSTGALFMLVGVIQGRVGTRALDRMGGLWGVAPRLGGAAMFFALASLGLPGLGNFVAEFMVVLGAYQHNSTLGVLAALGFLLSTVYALWMMHRAFFGENKEGWKVPDLTFREMGVVALMAVPLLWLGLYPQPLVDRIQAVSSQAKKAAVQKVAGTSSVQVIPGGVRGR